MTICQVFSPAEYLVDQSQATIDIHAQHEYRHCDKKLGRNQASLPYRTDSGRRTGVCNQRMTLMAG